MDPSTEPKSIPRTRWWNISAMLKDVWRYHKREKPLAAAPGIRQSIFAIFKSSRLNVLLIFIPISWAFHFAKLNNALIFFFSVLAITPLANLIDFARDDLSLRFGQTLAGLLTFTLDNTVETIVAIIALVKCQLTVVQTSLVGSILSNLLLILGIDFFAGGIRFSEQGFSIDAARINSYLLNLSVIAVLLPAAFHNAVQPANGFDPLTDKQEVHDILSISHSVAIILLFIYLCYLVFQLFSHRNLYDDGHSRVQQSIAYPPKVAKRLRIPVSSPPLSTDADAEVASEEEEEKPQMSLQTIIGLLVVVTVLVGITAGSLLDSIDGLTKSGRISKGFVGFILLPTVGNMSKRVIVAMFSARDEITMSFGVAVGSSIQIALFVIPFIVILGWIMDKPLTLLFDPFESISLFLSVLTVNYVVQDGKSNWLNGMMLICLYAIVAVTVWYYPISDPAGILATCN